MPIFARRTLQRLIDTVAPLSTAGKIGEQIGKLNKGGEGAISTAWELAVVAALSQMGVIRIEPDFGTPQRVDFELAMASPPWAAIGDVVTVFDEGMHQASGLTALLSLIWERVQAHRLVREHFHLWIEGDVEGQIRRRRIRLPKLKRAELLQDLDVFLGSVSSRPTQVLTVDLRKHGHGVQIKYDPKQFSGSWSGTKVNAVYGIDANPLMNALKRKANQLRRTNYVGPRIIVCCDGGSDSLRARPLSAWNTPNTEDIVREFLRQNTSVAGVIVVIVNASPIWPVLNGRERMLYLTPALTGIRATGTDQESINKIALQLSKLLPQTLRSPSSFTAPWEAGTNYHFFRFMGSNVMSSHRIQVPMRALLELLAGTRTQADFLNRYVFRQFAGGPPEVNLFKHWSEQGFVITSARVVSVPESDDDWVEFSLGPDSATTGFRNSNAIENSRSM